MSHRNIENGLALLGAILVLVGVTFAASSALGDEQSGGRWSRSTVELKAGAERTDAESASRRAADAAIDAIARDNRRQLEIRLHGRTSKVRES